MKMNKVFSVLGWLLIVGSIAGSVLAYTIVNSQEFVVALLARVVEEPFEYRGYVALLSAAMIALGGCLVGAVYLGLAEVLRRSQTSTATPEQAPVGDGGQ